MNETQKRRAIESLRKMAALEGFTLPEKVIQFTASYVKPTPRDHAGALIRLKAYQSMTKTPLSVDTARDILKPFDLIAARREATERAITFLRKKVARDRFTNTRDLEDIIQHLASSVKPTQRDLGRAFDDARDLIVGNAERKRQDSITIATLVKGASDSWPVQPKSADWVKLYHKTFYSARKRTGEQLTQWMKQVRTESKYRFSADSIPPNDPLAIETLLRQPNDFMNLPAWIRGCDWPSFKAVLRAIRPTSVLDIAIAYTLCQRTPVQRGNTARYLSLAKNSKIIPVDSLIEPITRTTRGCFIFREQFMETAWRVAGLSMDQRRQFRRGLEVQSVESWLSIARETFLHGAKARNIPRRRALGIFETCSAAGNGGIGSRGWSLEFAYLNYRMAYMKAHFPRETTD